MPVMNGYEVCAELKKDPLLAAIPVIFISAYGETMGQDPAPSARAASTTSPSPSRSKRSRRGWRCICNCDDSNASSRPCSHGNASSRPWRDTMVHMIVHDLRAPLTAVFNYLDLVREQEAGFISVESMQNAGSGHEGVTLDGSDGERPSWDASKIEAGQMSLRLVECDVGDLLVDAIDAIRSLADEKNVVFRHVHLRGVVDRDTISRVVQNLVSNAVKLTPPGGDVRVTLAAQANRIRVEVSDHGPGIAAQHHPKIFEKFGQLDTNVRQSVPSSGLGHVLLQARGGSPRRTDWRRQRGRQRQHLLVRATDRRPRTRSVVDSAASKS